ncbi:DUF1579 domain-containing protein [Piscinibacter sp. XHJ-5]|uniref:DUF1579 domain-containing protein n=1 Tax=Piscinibacter sp. XHJ-5 TaxID=3037797 RepID=UPI002452E670|nr:DUF1579 domain-containing protein [Piscinibacter sp. XHJ-5]
MDKIEPQAEHQWLHRMVGEWTGEGEAAMEPGKPPVKWKTFERVRSIAGLWVLAEGEGEMPEGGRATTLMTLGYDPQKKRFVGSFIGSMMANLWLYDGALDASGKVLTLDSEGPSFNGDGTLAKYQDVIEFVSDAHRLMRSRVLGTDGRWNEFMMLSYRRA